MNKIVLALGAMAFLTGCDPFEGLLSVKEAFVIKSTQQQAGCSPDSSYNCDQVVNVTIPVGDVNAKFEFPSKTQIRIETKISGKKTTLNLELPKKLKIPENGTFAVSAADLGQAFGAAGVAETKVTDGPIRQDREQCSYTRYETRCSVVNGQTVCHQYPVTVWGWRWTEYYDRNTDQKMNVNFGNDSHVVATFAGARSYRERVVRYQGQCF